MLTEEATVIGVEADGLWVETLQTSACNQCRARAGCGQRLLAGAGASMTHVKALYGSDTPSELWCTGDRVLIGIQEDDLVSGALLVYAVPLFSMLFAIAVGALLSFPEFVLALFALAGLGVGGWFVNRQALSVGLCRKTEPDDTDNEFPEGESFHQHDSHKYHPVIIRKL